MPPEPDHPPLLLVGTVIGESTRIGVFLEEATGRMVRLETGEVHGGWLLRGVETREVRFEKAHRAATLVLRPPGAEPTTAFLGEPTTKLVGTAHHRKR
jgi:hypothetical protein